MSQLLRGSPATPGVGSAPPSAGSPQPNPTLVLVTEQEVGLSAAIRRIVTSLPEPRPYYPRRECNYYEAARMAREMDHL